MTSPSIVTLSFLVASFLLPPLAYTQPGRADGTDQERVSLDSARRMIVDAIMRDTPDMNPAAEFPLVELTTDETWSRLHVQVFKITGGPREDDGYLIDSGRVIMFAPGFGGWGLMSMCVTDLESSGVPELLFTYSWGSGVHRSVFAAYSRDWPEDQGIRTGSVVFDDDLLLWKCDDQTVYLEQISSGDRSGGPGDARIVGIASIPISDLATGVPIPAATFEGSGLEVNLDACVRSVVE
jgi:hypothetical protein